MPRRPTATILKLIQGDAHKDRQRNDAPKVDSLPQIPPGCVLSEKEQAMFNWLLETIAVPGVHGAGDGAAFVLVARLWTQKNDVDAKLATQGPVMKSPEGKPEINPNARLSRDLQGQLRLALADIGATPGGRFKINGPRSAAMPGEATSWDEID